MNSPWIESDTQWLRAQPSSWAKSGSLGPLPISGGSSHDRSGTHPLETHLQLPQSTPHIEVLRCQGASKTRSVVGGITVQYPACLYSLVLVPTVIPQFSFMAQCFFDHEIRRKSCLQAALIYSHPLLVLHSTPYLFWKVRNGTCQFSVYMLFLSGPFKPGHVLYIVRKVFSRQTQRRRNRENRFGGSRDIQCTSWEY